MSSIGVDERLERELHAYHDGELRGLARWRFERRLARSSALRGELALLGQLREVVREADGAVATPDLWDAIALRLPAADAAPESDREKAAGWLTPLLRPVAAVAATAGVALALAIGLTSDDTAPVGVISWMDSGGRSVMVLEEQADTTIIWVFDNASEGARRGEPSVSV